MTTTCAAILTRTLALSVANQGLLDENTAADVQETLDRLNQLQAKAFTRFISANRSEFLATTAMASSAANGGRVVDLSTIDPPLQRLVRLTLRSSGVEVALVDPAVPASELAPRYYTAGNTLVEISNDWDTTTTDTVTLDLLYVFRPADLDTTATAALTQPITIPDRYADVLVYWFGSYLAEKDVGREDAEVADLLAKGDAVLETWIASAGQMGGVQAYTFDIPSPAPRSKG